MDEGTLTEAESLQLQIDALSKVLLEEERWYLERAAVQKDLYDKGNLFSGGLMTAYGEAADQFRRIHSVWIENYG
jgi:hypothetical protein